ncbi:hypothetical protein LBMAG56_28180 [Verrucomicrobiota bacterium]|nr:hypothetical protein LBMAG56_28180 [Verrucomicrobiota bacterium]
MKTTGCRRLRWLAVVVLLGVLPRNLPVTLSAQTPKPRADHWLAGTYQYPAVAGGKVGSTAGFELIETDAIAGRLKVYWNSGAAAGSGNVTLFASADTAGHWPARDWRPYPMSFRAGRWEASVPVESVDIPMIFFLRVGDGVGAGARLSAMRTCVPRAAGLEEPSRIFWPYLEGFEDGLMSWRSFGASSGVGPLEIDPLAKQGKASLRVTVPGAGQSVGVATTRVRGWQIVERSATGLRLWMRTRSGAGRVRFTLFANAGGPLEVVMAYDREVTLSDRWQKVDLAFGRFGKGPLAEVDLLALEFSADGAREFLMDELQLLGPWKLEVE